MKGCLLRQPFFILLFFAIYIKKKKNNFHCSSLSGYQDSNLGPPAPKAGALTGLRYIPIAL